MVNYCGETKQTQLGDQTGGQPYESSDQANKITKTFVLYSTVIQRYALKSIWRSFRSLNPRYVSRGTCTELGREIGQNVILELVVSMVVSNVVLSIWLDT